MIKSKKQFEFLVGYKFEQLKDIIDRKSEYHYSYSQKKRDDKGNLKIVDGVVQRRVFNPSKKELKNIQSRLQHKILNKIPIIENFKGGIRGNSNIANARAHLGRKYRFQTDIKNCFPSISSKMVYNSLKTKGFSSAIAEIISKLVTLSTKESVRGDCLAQGDPTSTTIANIVMEKIGLKILDLIHDKDIRYTQWVDDLVFSSQDDFQYLVPEIISLITENGFKVSRAKTTYRKNKSLITGIVVGMSTIKESEKFRNKENASLSDQQKIGRANYRKSIYSAKKSRK